MNADHQIYSLTVGSRENPQGFFIVTLQAVFLPVGSHDNPQGIFLIIG